MQFTNKIKKIFKSPDPTNSALSITLCQNNDKHLSEKGKIKTRGQTSGHFKPTGWMTECFVFYLDVKREFISIIFRIVITKTNVTRMKSRVKSHFYAALAERNEKYHAAKI